MVPCAKRKIPLLALGIGALLLAAALLSIPGKRQGAFISINELERKLDNDETFVLQIELEGCPACDLLHENAKTSTSYRGNKPLIVRIPTGKKEEARTKLHQLIPQFEYYPSIFLISHGSIASEFDLSSLDDFDGRYEQWITDKKEGPTR